MRTFLELEKIRKITVNLTYRQDKKYNQTFKQMVKTAMVDLTLKTIIFRFLFHHVHFFI
jgi:hypothetical protein